MINPGSRPVENASEDQAAHNLRTFVLESEERGLRLDGEPQRHPEADVDGRYAWILPLEGGSRVQVLMPGAELAQLRGFTAEAYVVKVGENNWWWNDATAMVIPIARANTSADAAAPGGG